MSTAINSWMKTHVTHRTHLINDMQCKLNVN